MSNEEEKQEKRGFKVEDRRRFSDSGEARADKAGESAERPAAHAEEPHTAATRPGSAPHDIPPPPPLNFSTFILGLSTQVLAQLGEIPSPIDNQIATDLVAAQHLIDILGILKDKTKGNLDSAESGLLDAVLYDLRLKYVERVRGRS